MTNLEIVGATLSKIKNVNGGITLDMISDMINAGLEAPIISRAQITRAMRDQSLAVKVSAGVWRIKGRATNKPVAAMVYPRYIRTDAGLNKREMKKLQIRVKRALTNV